MKKLWIDGVKKDFPNVVDMIDTWKAHKVTWRQMVAVYRRRNIWLMILRNFRDLEGSWPGALQKVERIFHGRPVKRPWDH